MIEHRIIMKGTTAMAGNGNENDEKSEWSCTPFISMDGGDGHGGAPAEVIVTKGVGHVKDIDNHGRSANIAITVQGLKYPIHGSINTDDPAFAIAQDAYERKELVQFRHEISRKKGVDRSKTMAEIRNDPNTHRPSPDIAKENTKKLFVGFGPVGGELILSHQHLTNPAADNNDNASEGVAADSNAAVMPATATTAFNMPETSGEFESRPWIGVNRDGNINPGSYAVSCMPKMFFTLVKRFPDADDNILKGIVEDLVRCADAMQIRVYKDCCGGSLTEANRFYNSHQVARQIMLDIIDNDLFELKNPSNANEVKAWEKDIANYAKDIWEWSINNYASTLANN